MKIEIRNDEKVGGVIDLLKFASILKTTDLDIKKAILESTTITKNDLKWTPDYIRKLLLAEIDWTAVILNYKNREGDKMYFRVCPIIFQHKLEYEKYSKSKDYSRVELKETIKNGIGYILINSFNPNPEHNIDIWLSKSIFPYPKGEWKKEIGVVDE